MEKFLKQWRTTPNQSRYGIDDGQLSSNQIIEENEVHIDEVQPISKRSCVENEVSDATNIVTDPGLGKQIIEYHPNERDIIRRAYLLKGPCQPILKPFPQTLIGRKKQGFCSSWYNDFGSWIKYNIHEDVVFCLYCYLFGANKGAQGGGGTFSRKRFKNWERKDKVQDHVGGVNSAHNQSYKTAQDLLNQDQHITIMIRMQSDQARIDYRVCLNAVTGCVRFLLKQGLAFRGNDESENSNNRGNFLELLQYTCNHNEAIKVAIENAPKNLKLTSPNIQRDIVNATAIETTNAILKDRGYALFSILIDETQDVSIKEQMALVLRYVDKDGCVIKAFLGKRQMPKHSNKQLKK